VTPEWAAKAARQMLAYEQMGAVPTWTCAPYQTHMRPVFGQQIAWGESNAIAFANSVIGARTERYPDLLDICCAITGRVPAIGLHLTDQRAGQMLLQLDGVSPALQQDDQFFAVLGHLIGKLAEDLIPVIDGVLEAPPEDQLKAFAAAVASSGRVALFHMVGVTPEAPTRDAAFQGRQPQRTQRITVADLRAARNELTTADGRELDMVILGSPHFSVAEFARLAPLVAGRRAHPRVKFLVTSSRLMKERAHEQGVLGPILEFGAQVTLDTCILASPMLPPEIKTLMTNSAKYAYYAPSLLNTRVTFGSLADCVTSAIEGRVVRDDTVWRTG
jgi:cis-L-3-hydroxyproline dehydratase